MVALFVFESLKRTDLRESFVCESDKMFAQHVFDLLKITEED